MNEDLKLNPSPLYVVVKIVYILLAIIIVISGIVGMLGLGANKEEMFVYPERFSDNADMISSNVALFAEVEQDGIDCL